MLTVCNTSYINALSVCELLAKIREKFKAASLPITLVLDNAKYQKCQMVKDLATKLNIELLFLPSYSPNLNLIERLWKFIKKDCLYCEYYESFESFVTAIDKCIENIKNKHFQVEIKTLLNLKFQMFDDEIYDRA